MSAQDPLSPPSAGRWLANCGERERPPAAAEATAVGDLSFIVVARCLRQATQDRWRAINRPHLVTLVRAGATFKKGVLVENPNEVAA